MVEEGCQHRSVGLKKEVLSEGNKSVGQASKQNCAGAVTTVCSLPMLLNCYFFHFLSLLHWFSFFLSSPLPVCPCRRLTF